MGIIQRLLYKRRRYFDDDFDWDNYTADSYARRLKDDVEKRFRAISHEGQLTFDPATGTVRSEGEPIHPNQNLILETIGRLNPASVHEVGCGGGDHLANAARLFPGTEVTGGDRSAGQIRFALERHPQLRGRLGIQDITMPYSKAWPTAELVYTQAVIMHIHTAVSHFVALSNLVRAAGKWVLLVENWQCHHFVRDLQLLHGNGHLEWDDLHIYRVEGSTGGRGILLSRLPMDLPALTGDDDIREGLAPSKRRLKRADQDSARGLFGFERS